MRTLVLVVLLVWWSPVAGQSVSGYAKNLLIESSSPVDGKPYWLNITRMRVQTEAASGSWQAKIWTDLEARTGSFFNRPEAAFAFDGRADQRLDLDWEISRGQQHQVLGRIFRATLSRYGDRVSMTLGRQRVAWGTGFVWTPTDLLNPVSPTSIERDEKGAVDAFSVSLETGGFSGLDFVVAENPGEPASLAGRFRTHLGEYDASLSGGSVSGQPWAGGDFAGYLGNAGLRGEVAVSRGQDDNWRARGIINTDYSFQNGVYGLVELHYNGAGATRKEDYDRIALLTGRLSNLGQWYAASVVSYPISPLVGASAYLISNLTDGSGLLGPSMSWSVTADVQFAASAYFFFGASDAEFGELDRVGFVSMQYFF